MIFTKDCGKIPVWLFTVPCEEKDDHEGRNAGEQRRLLAERVRTSAPARLCPPSPPTEPGAVLAPIAKPGAPLIPSHPGAARFNRVVEAAQLELESASEELLSNPAPVRGSPPAEPALSVPLRCPPSAAHPPLQLRPPFPRPRLLRPPTKINGQLCAGLVACGPAHAPSRNINGCVRR